MGFLFLFACNCFCEDGIRGKRIQKTLSSSWGGGLTRWVVGPIQSLVFFSEPAGDRGQCRKIRFSVRAEIITELIPKRAGPVIFKTFLLELIAFRPIPVICPARRVKPENDWKR